MTNRWITGTAAAAVTLLLLLAPSPARAQQPPAPQAGFSVETLVSDLSLFMPGDFGALGGRPGGAAGAQRAQGAQGGAQGGAGQGAANAFRLEKDPKLAFTAEQIAKLIPVFEGLKANPMPSPNAAKKVQSTVDSILTKAQKAGIEKFTKDREEMIKQFQSRMQAQGGGAQGGGQFRQRDDAQGGGAQGGTQARPQLNAADRRARVVEVFLQALLDAQKSPPK